MTIVGVHIHSYRGIDDLMIPLGPVTVLIGRNGAGKSSVLEAIGFEPSEEGALERRDDLAPVVSWFRTAESGEVVDILGSNAQTADHVPGPTPAKLLPYIVVRDGNDGSTRLAFNVFRAVLDHPVQRQQPILERLLTNLGQLDVPWSRDLAAQLRKPELLRPFIEFGPAIESVDAGRSASFHPPVVSMTTVPDDISPTLMRGVRELAPSAYAALSVARPDVQAAVDAVALGRLAPLFRLGLLQPLLKLIEDRANLLAPDFISGPSGSGDPKGRTGLLTVDLLESSDTRTGTAVARLLELADRLEDPELSSALREVAITLAGSGESFDMHLDCSLVSIRNGSPHQFAFSRLGTGSRRWVCGAIDEAIRDVAAGLRADPISLGEAELIAAAGVIAMRAASSNALQLRLIDEPLESLEASAHANVLGWLRARASASETLVLSSHHASVLRAAANDDDLEVIGLDRIDGNVTARIFGPSLLKGLRESFSELGLRREDLLFNARALLLLEGPDDVRVMEAVFGDDLYEMGVLMQALGGTGAPQVIAAFTHSGYELLGLSAWAMWDGRRDDSLADDAHCASADSSTPSQLQTAAAALGPDRIRLLPFEPADICLGLTPHCYELAFPGGFRQGGRKLRGDAVLREMQACRTSGEAKKLLLTLLGKDPTSNFSQAIMTPTLQAIRQHGLGRSAANKWLRSSMARLTREISADRS